MPGRPGPRRLLKSHFLATKRRCHRIRVSGDTTVSSASSALRPTALAFLASNARAHRRNECACRTAALSAADCQPEDIRRRSVGADGPSPRRSSASMRGAAARIPCHKPTAKCRAKNWTLNHQGSGHQGELTPARGRASARNAAISSTRVSAARAKRRSAIEASLPQFIARALPPRSAIPFPLNNPIHQNGRVKRST